VGWKRVFKGIAREMKRQAFGGGRRRTRRRRRKR